MNKINIITSCLLGFSIVISQGEDFATDFTEEDLKDIGFKIQNTKSEEAKTYLLNLFKEKYKKNNHQDYKDVLDSDCIWVCYCLECCLELTKQLNENINNIGKLSAQFILKIWEYNKDKDKDKDNKKMLNLLYSGCENFVLQLNSIYDTMDFLQDNIIKHFGAFRELLLPKNFSNFYSKMANLIDSGKISEEDEVLFWCLAEYLQVSDYRNLMIKFQEPQGGFPLLENFKIIIIPKDGTKLAICTVFTLKDTLEKSNMMFFRSYVFWSLSQIMTKTSIAAKDEELMAKVKELLKIIPEVSDMASVPDLQKLNYDLTNHIKNVRKLENKSPLPLQEVPIQTIEFTKTLIGKDDIVNINIKNQDGSHFSGTCITRSGETKNIIGCATHGKDIQNSKKNISNVSVVEVKKIGTKK